MYYYAASLPRESAARARDGDGVVGTADGDAATRRRIRTSSSK